MMDHLTDTPSLARMYCPGCEPAADPAFEILDVRWCASHAPQGRGLDDEVVVASAWISGSSEAGGNEGSPVHRVCSLCETRMIAPKATTIRADTALTTGLTPRRAIA